MRPQYQTLLATFLHCLVSTSDSSGQAAPPGDDSTDQAAPPGDDQLFLIAKCCPTHLYLDSWYDCVDGGDGESVLAQFKQELAEVGKKNESEYQIVEADYWNKCPVRLRREYEVINISDDDDKVYVISDMEIIDDDEDEQDFKSLLEIEYECLEVSREPQSLVAVVCENEQLEDDPSSFIRKCCPSGEALSSDYSTCLPSKQARISPRKILHSDTEKMTGWYSVKYGDGGCSEDDIMVTESAHSVLTDGTFFPLSRDSLDLTEEREPYHCVDAVTSQTDSEMTREHELVAVICLKRGCNRDFCVSKCCPENEMFVHGGTFCSPVNKTPDSWTHVNRLYTHQLRLIPHETMKHISVEYQHSFMDNYRKYKNRVPNCDQVVILDKSNNDTFYILQNGSLHHKEYGLTNNFCVDNTLDKFGQVVEIALKCVEGQEIVVKKHDEVISDETTSCLDQYLSILRLFNTVSGSISCIFLAITFLVYICVPELNSLHGKIVLSNVFSIFFLTAYLLLVYNFSHLLPHLACQIAGYSGYFFTMSMFSWMTIMSFDLCWTFMRAKVPRKGSALLKFVIYSAVAWGSSAAFTLGIILADQMMEDQTGNHKLFFTKPNVGKLKCFLQDDAQGMFLHLPCMVLMMINAVFFLITTTTLYRCSLISN